MMNYWYGFGFFPIFQILWVFIVIAIIVGIFRGGHWRRHWRDEQSAEEILRERFAKGEINEKEFKQRMKVLMEREK